MVGSTSPTRRRRTAGVAAALLLAAALSGPGRPAGADAGPDLALSRPGGPVGTEVDLFSADLFDMGADTCPGIEDPEEPFGPDDSFEVRWELGVLDGQGTPLDADGSSGYRYALATDPVLDVIAAGGFSTEPDEPWRTTLTIPAGPQPGDALVVNASCWRTGPDVAGGEEVWFDYFYLAVFVVTGPDGVIPPVVPPTTSTTTTAPAGGPGATPQPPAEPRPGSPRPPVGRAPSATPRPGSASFTG